MPYLKKSLFQAVISLSLGNPLFGLSDHTQVTENFAFMWPTEPIIHIEDIHGGLTNTLWKIDTDTRSYVLRSSENKVPSTDYQRLYEASTHASELNIAPKIFAVNLENQHMLLEYIENMPWPTYEENKEPYHKTMKRLRCFHSNMKRFLLPKQPNFAPYSYVIDEIQTINTSKLPVHFIIAFERLHLILQKMTPWLNEYAVLCHGDFHKGNVLLCKKTQKPLLIDFDSMQVGDPFFDVAKFSASLPWTHKWEMLCEYLGHSPSLDECEHFEYADLTLLMVIATIRLKSCLESQDSDLLTKEQMDELLDSTKFHPSFQTVILENISIKEKQLSALYALSEFLRRTDLLINSF